MQRGQGRQPPQICRSLPHFLLRVSTECVYQFGKTHAPQRRPRTLVRPRFFHRRIEIIATIIVINVGVSAVVFVDHGGREVGVEVRSSTPSPRSTSLRVTAHDDSPRATPTA